MWYISPFDFRAIFIRGKKLIRKLLIVQLHVYIELYLNKEDLELSFLKWMIVLYSQRILVSLNGLPMRMLKM